MMNSVEVRRGTAGKRSHDLGLGVISQSCAVIAGSSQSGPQSSLTGVCNGGRATDLDFRGRNSSDPSQTPNAIAT